MTDQDLELIENFITKEEPRMEFNEMQALVKMIYDIYRAVAMLEKGK